MYKAYLRRCRDEKALREEAPSAPPTTPDRTQSNQDAPNQARTQMQAQYQSQPMVRTRTYRNPRQGASSGEAQTTTVVHGVTIHPPFPQTQSGPLPQTLYQPQIQPQQNVVANAHEGLPLHAANRDHRELLEFGHRNGWLIWRNIEIRGHHMLHERIIVVSTFSMSLCLFLTGDCGFVSIRQRGVGDMLSLIPPSFFVDGSGYRFTDKIIGDVCNHHLPV